MRSDQHEKRVVEDGSTLRRGNHRVAVVALGVTLASRLSLDGTESGAAPIEVRESTVDHGSGQLRTVPGTGPVRVRGSCAATPSKSRTETDVLYAKAGLGTGGSASCFNGTRSVINERRWETAVSWFGAGSGDVVADGVVAKSGSSPHGGDGEPAEFGCQLTGPQHPGVVAFAGVVVTGQSTRTCGSAGSATPCARRPTSPSIPT